MVKNILGLNSFFMINKKLVEKLSLESALFLAILADASGIFETEWFYQTNDTIQDISKGFLTRRKQEQAIKELSHHGIIEIKLMGLPRKRYYKISEENLLKFLRD